jgi:transglutaminase-like putative cysteine protease
MKEFLDAGRFIDSESPRLIEYANDLTAQAENDLERVLQLYRNIRDGIVYDPYVDLADPENYRASSILERRRGFCIGKAALLAACARTVHIPARVGFADVRNHLTSSRFYEYIKSDIFIWHSYADLYIAGQWVKATPAFDLALCNRVGLKPLEFDGKSDSLLHPFDRSGRRHMEYLKDRGTFADVPFETIQSDFRHTYPMLMDQRGLPGDFRAEAVAVAGD